QSRKPKGPNSQHNVAFNRTPTTYHYEADAGMHQGMEDEGSEMAAFFYTTFVGETSIAVAPRGMRQPDPLEPLELVPIFVQAARDTRHQATIEFLPDTGANVTCVPTTFLEATGISPSALGCTNPPPRTPRTASGATDGLRSVGMFRAR